MQVHGRCWGAALGVGSRGREGSCCRWLGRGSRAGCFWGGACMSCAHTRVSLGRLLSMTNNVYHKSCSARVHFYKINGAKTISSIANPSVSLGERRDPPRERSSGSLHLLPACSLEHWPRSEQPYPSVSPAPSVCTAGQPLASSDCRLCRE